MKEKEFVSLRHDVLTDFRKAKCGKTVDFQ